MRMNLKDSWGLKLIRFTDKMVTVSRVLTYKFRQIKQVKAKQKWIGC